MLILLLVILYGQKIGERPTEALKRRLHIQFVKQFGILFGPKKFGKIFDPNIWLHKGTIFGPNKSPYRPYHKLNV